MGTPILPSTVRYFKSRYLDRKKQVLLEETPFYDDSGTMAEGADPSAAGRRSTRTPRRLTRQRRKSTHRSLPEVVLAAAAAPSLRLIQELKAEPGFPLEEEIKRRQPAVSLKEEPPTDMTREMKILPGGLDPPPREAPSLTLRPAGQLGKRVYSILTR